MSINSIAIGQRWLSVMEPELGLGIITSFDEKKVSLHFSAARSTRDYSRLSAPIQRVIFKPGDVIKTKKGYRFSVESNEQRDGTLFYHGKGLIIPEEEISNTSTIEGPKYRILTGFTDTNEAFNFRYKTNLYKHENQIHECRGFVGGRVSIIPHQLYVANNVAKKSRVRALLSDETGLGKTIEACLIIHRLLLCGRIRRVLIIVPQPLVYQWFVELLRKFSLVAQIMEEGDFKKAEEKSSENPFFTGQLFISTFDFVSTDKQMRGDMLAGEWDMVIVDEAHHVIDQSPEYLFLEELCQNTKGVLLLTATPDQLGHKNHFCRLKLLDSDRYYDFEKFKREEKQYIEIAHFVKGLRETKNPGASCLNQMIDNLSSVSSPFKKSLGRRTRQYKGDGKESIIEETIDLLGPGNNVFRNTRRVIKGFPKRVVHFFPLDALSKEKKKITSEFYGDNAIEEKTLINYDDDPRIKWLGNFLLQNEDQKFLLICSSVEKSKNIEKRLSQVQRSKTVLFHENLSLLRRDQNAAWFSEDGGAQLMICSEIGSEGRNFQFSHHLVLFDLPLNPELLEQRIGRLDRIGQTQSINIHLPFVKGTPQELLVTWFHKGLNIFCENVTGSHIIYEKFKRELIKLLQEINFDQLEGLILRTKENHKLISAQLEKGRDKLLELNSFRPEKIKALLSKIEKRDEGVELEGFMAETFEHFGVSVDDLSDKTFKLNFDLQTSEDFPIPLGKREGLVATFDRKTALTHENVEFLTWDHPMVTGVTDLITGSDKGTAAYAIWPDKKSRELLIETVFIVECVAPYELFIDRFFPQKPIRIVVNQELKDRTHFYGFEKIRGQLKSVGELAILNNSSVKNELLPKMVEACHKIGEELLARLIEETLVKVRETKENEIDRLFKLRAVNPFIPKQEITGHKRELKELTQFIQSARLRTDAIRLIYRGQDIVK